MTVLTMRREHGVFVVTGPDIEPSSSEPGESHGIGVLSILEVHPSRKSAPTRKSR